MQAVNRTGTGDRRRFITLADKAGSLHQPSPAPPGKRKEARYGTESLQSIYPFWGFVMTPRGDAGRQYRLANAERIREYRQKYNQEHKEAARAQKKAVRDGLRERGEYVSWCKLHPDRTWVTQIMRRYGMSPPDYYEMVEAQGGKCAVCGTTDPGKRMMHWCIDHDHVTGRVRGLLCGNCNVMLGGAFDDVHVLQLGIAYLEIRS